MQEEARGSGRAELQRLGRARCVGSLVVCELCVVSRSMTEKNVYALVRLCDTSAPGVYMVPGVEKFRVESSGADQGDKDTVAVELRYKVSDKVLPISITTTGLYVQASPEQPDAEAARDFFRLSGVQGIADLRLTFPSALFVDGVKVPGSEPAGLVNPLRVQQQRLTPELLREHSSSHRSKRSRSSRYSSAESDSDSSTDHERDHSKVQS